jgi:hypothetical protein
VMFMKIKEGSQPLYYGVYTNLSSHLQAFTI